MLLDPLTRQIAFCCQSNRLISQASPALMHAQGGCPDVYTIRPCVVGAPGPVQLTVRDSSGRRGASTLQQDVLEVQWLPGASAGAMK